MTTLATCKDANNEILIHPKNLSCKELFGSGQISIKGFSNENYSSSSSSIFGAKKYLTCPISSMSYSTTNGTSGESDRIT